VTTAWPEVPLGEVADLIRGVTFKPADVEELGSSGTIACLRTANVQAELDIEDVWAIPEAFARRAEQRLRPGDIVVSSANSWNLVGKCSWVDPLPWPATFGGFVTTLRAHSDSLDARYLYRWFSSPKIQALVRSFGRKTTNISNLDLNRCRAMLMPLPPVEEQRRVAAILDAADELRAKRRKSLALLDSLTESIFLDMFGDPATNPKDLPVRALGELGAIVTGNTPPRANQGNYGSAIEWIKSDNIQPPQPYLTQAREGLSDEGRRIGRVAPAGSILVTCIAGVRRVSDPLRSRIVMSPSINRSMPLFRVRQTRCTFMPCFLLESALCRRLQRQR
jgi:type I restriction enzyme S subunit